MYNALCLFNDQFAHINPVERALENKISFTYTATWHPSEIDKENPDIIIGINEHHLGISECYAYAKGKNIPTLTLQDGILEWRHMFENPLYNGLTGPPLHAPVLADKMACIGLTSASLIGCLGNWHKVELTGMPKMDDLKFTSSASFKTIGNSRKKILILTSSKPWFTDRQREIVLQELTDLKNKLAELSNVQVVWRVTKDLPKILGIDNTYSEKSTVELGALIEECDAVITTISTTILESQLLERPTAILDYFNTSNFVGTRWAIRHISQMDNVLTEILNPTQTDKRIQDFFLQQNITLGVDSAAQRTAQLILLMIEFNRNNPGQMLPANLLKKSFYPQALPMDVEEMPTNKLLENQNEILLRQEVINRLKYQNQQLEDRLKSRSLYSVMQKVFKVIKRTSKLK
jgi:hypothetical protein